MTTVEYGYLVADQVPGRPFGRAWWLTVPWAHPLWHSYMVSLADLTTVIERPPQIYMPGATHEIMVYALDPAHPAQSWPPHVLTPPNLGYQFKAESNEAAEKRIIGLLDLVQAGKLSPDTDYRSLWDQHFADGTTLHIGSIIAQAGTLQ